MRIPRMIPLSIDHLSTFLNSPAPSQEDARGDLKSLWSSVRASLHHTHANIHIYSDSASVRCEDVEVRWAKRKEVNQLLKQATQSRHLMSLQQATDQGRASYSTCLSEASNHFIYSAWSISHLPAVSFCLTSPSKPPPDQDGTSTKWNYHPEHLLPPLPPASRNACAPHQPLPS